MDQVDSINLTYDYLDECEEYTDSLQSTIGGLNVIIDSSKLAEDHLKDALDLEEKINFVNSKIIKELKSDNKTLKRKLKFNKFVARITSVATIILTAIVLIPGA